MSNSFKLYPTLFAKGEKFCRTGEDPWVPWLRACVDLWWKVIRRCIINNFWLHRPVMGQPWPA